MTDRPQTAAQPRDFLHRAKDELSSWFGDADAAGRRQRDLATGDHSGQGPQSDLDPDARIVDDLSRRMTDDPELDASRIEVASASGKVTLLGEVRTSAQRSHAEELAHVVAGVSQVENRLQVA